MATGGKRRERVERQEMIKCTVRITVTNAGKLLSLSYLFASNCLLGFTGLLGFMELGYLNGGYYSLGYAFN